MSDQSLTLFPKRSETYPEASDLDAAYSASKTALSTVPVFGPLTAEVLSHFLAPPLTRRRDSWFKELADDFDVLKERVDGVNLDQFVKDENFISAVIEATRIAVGSHQTDKRKMLRNALLNISVGKAPEEDMQHIYLQLLEKLTPSHLKVLKLLHSPHQYLKGRAPDLHIQLGMQVDAAIEAVIPELAGKKDMVKNILLDLYNSSLTPTWGEHNVIQNPAITNNGISFLNFVLTSPLD